MKVVIKNTGVSTATPFPKLMVYPSTEEVVLFHKYRVGTYLNGNNTGIQVQTMNMEGFIDFFGVITLSND
jgi:hypothetical protein